MHLWTVGAVANGVIAVTYMTIGVLIGRAILRSGQWRNNPLGVATAAIFVAGGIAHSIRVVLLLQPTVADDWVSGLGARAMFTWPVALWDLLAAGIGLYYLSLRNRFAALLRGAALFEDLKERQKQALDIHDNVVQGLATAKLAFELDRRDEGMREIEQTLEHARGIVNGLLGDSDSEIALGPGDLRRRSPAGGAR